MERRKSGMTDTELELLADLLANKLHASPHFCTLTQEQQIAVIDLLNTKKKAVKITLWLFGALLLWIVKDIYLYIREHLGWFR